MNDGLSRKRKIRNKAKGKRPKGMTPTEAIMDTYGEKAARQRQERIEKIARGEL